MFSEFWYSWDSQTYKVIDTQMIGTKEFVSWPGSILRPVA